MDLEHEAQLNDSYNDLITHVVSDLYSFNETAQKRILDYYYFHDATFVSPLLTTEGMYNIRNILLLWKALNKTPPTITNICFNGQTCIVHLTQNLCPRIFPYLRLSLPVITTLSFRETDIDSGLLKIHRHEESWTVEGLIQNMPLIAYWYDNVLRVMMGKILSSTGFVLHSASDTSRRMLTEDQQAAYKKTIK